MASSKRSSTKFSDQSEFINYPLSAEQKKEVKSWHPTFEDFDDELLKICEAGYKITLRYDERNEAHAAWLVVTDSEHANAGFILSGRGSTPLKALKQALYIHSLFEGDWAGNYASVKSEALDD